MGFMRSRVLCAHNSRIREVLGGIGPGQSEGRAAGRMESSAAKEKNQAQLTARTGAAACAGRHIFYNTREKGRDTPKDPPARSVRGNARRIGLPTPLHTAPEPPPAPEEMAVPKRKPGFSAA
jgi:hypothetical protein